MTDNDRRERYAAALAVETNGVYDVHDHLEIGTPDAAMAVADEEQNARTQALLDEITRLHAENVRLVDLRNLDIATMDAQRASNARLRVELDAANRGRSLLNKSKANAEAAIKRVRAVLDEYSDDPYAQFLAAAVRAALKGDSE